MKVRWVTNIPTPYRNHRHRAMAEVMRARGFDYAVYYMAWTEPERTWSFGPRELAHPHRFFAGAHAELRGIYLHFNPGLLLELRRAPPDVVVIGGWANPTLLLAPFVTRRSMRILGVESNPDSLRWRTGLPAAVRTAMVRNADAFVGPAERSRDLIAEIDPRSVAKPFFLLPNVVDESVWRDGVAAISDSVRAEERARLGVRDDEQLWVCPARLEWYKGLEQFLDQLDGQHGFVLAIAGEGSLRGSLEERIARGNLPVRLLGQRTEPDVQRLYAAGDLFVLPSVSDANPLSAVEAAAAGLPQWLSVRCGNYTDVVAEGANGFRYDPDDAANNRVVLQEILSQTRAQLRARGRISLERFQQTWDTRACVERVVDQMHAAVVARARG